MIPTARSAVSGTDPIDELLVRWQQLRRHGAVPSVPELCSDHPSWAEELARRIAAFESMEALLGVGQSPTLPDRGAHSAIPPHLAEKLLPLGYELLEVIDQGGMGIVYKANQVALRRTVALKMIAGFRAGAKQLARFRTEAEAVARLHHPHIVQIHDVGEVDGHSFFTMEYVAGGTLADLFAAGPLAPPAAAELVEQLARAVHHAHTRGVVHRDLKPANILLAGEFETRGTEFETDDSLVLAELEFRPSALTPKVSDFGLAKHLESDDDHTATGEVIGTPSYMAPEQAEGRTDEIGPAADVYALGALLYEALTGRPPFRGKSVVETLRMVVSDEPRSPRRLRPDVPRDLEAICLKCLEKDPRRRYATAEALADDLRDLAAGRPVTARPLTLAGRVGKWTRRHPVVTGLLVVAALTPAAVAGWEYYKQQHERRRVAARAVEVAPQAREILMRHCYECHGGDARKTKEARNFLVMERSSLFDPKRKGVVPGHPGESRLILRIEDRTMPPESKELSLPGVTDAELAILRDWIAGGAPPFPPEDPANPTPPVVPYSPLAAEVKALFVARCYECHKVDDAGGGIKVMNHRLLTTTRRVVIPGDPDGSELYQLLVTDNDDTVMPPVTKGKHRLTSAEIDVVRRWIAEGAPPFPKTPE